MANGGFANVTMIGRIMSEPQVRSGKNASYAQIDLGEWPKTDDERKRGMIRISLKMLPEQRVPKKGAVIYVASGTYHRNPSQKQDGEVIYFHNLTAYIWRVLPVGQTAGAATTAAVSRPATDDQPSQATPPPSSLDDEDEDVPF